MTSRGTSGEVAARAGVSQSTVSLVLSGKASGRVSKALQERVVQAARELQYRPHQSARALRSGRAHARRWPIFAGLATSESRTSEPTSRAGCGSRISTHVAIAR